MAKSACGRVPEWQSPHAAECTNGKVTIWQSARMAKSPYSRVAKWQSPHLAECPNGRVNMRQSVCTNTDSGTARAGDGARRRGRDALRRPRRDDFGDRGALHRAVGDAPAQLHQRVAHAPSRGRRGWRRGGCLRGRQSRLIAAAADPKLHCVVIRPPWIRELRAIPPPHQTCTETLRIQSNQEGKGTRPPLRGADPRYAARR
eukprot:gene7319-biopygen268